MGRGRKGAINLLLIKSLQIQGFKSFPDKVKLNFGEGVTATVGPNGSGKSNVSDAVRWVLGEQGKRALRVESWEKIVFDGTNARRAAGFAEVIMTVDNTGRWLNYDADEVAIGRRYYRSGTSEYKINGKSVLWRDINELFMDTGIGRDGYSMISQGKVAEIVDAKPADRRVIFEEAAGISKYRYCKQETERNLSKAEENLTHLNVIAADLEARVGPLEKECEKAKKALELGEVLKKEEVGLWLLTLNRSTAVMRDQGYKITLLETQYGELVSRAERLEAEVDGLYAEGNRLTAQKDELLRDAASLEEQATRLDGEADVVRAQITHDNQDIERLEREIEESRQGAEQLRENAAHRRAELEEKKAEAEKLQGEMAGLKEQIEQLRADESGQSTRLLGLRERQNALTLALSEQQLRVARAQSQLDEITGRSGTLEQTIAERQERAVRLAAELEQTVQALAAAKEKAAELGNAISGHRMRLDSQRRKAEEAKRSADELRLDANDKRRRAAAIEDLERSLEGYDHSVRRVIKFAEGGGLRGIHGPVSRIIDVDARYAVAVETALGGAIKHVIVDDENAGKRAMEYLKANKGGRATFLPISVIKPRSLSENGLDECPGYVEIASRLVRCEERYRAIVENLLGNVCIVEDIDSAISIARRYKNRFRLVTLDGQVINAGGSMTGGSSDRNAGLLSRRGELEQYRAQAEKLEAKAAEAAKEAELQRQRAAAEEAALIAAQSELACANEDRVGFEGEQKRLNEQLQLNAEQLAAFEQERDGAFARVTALNAERDEAAQLAAVQTAELDGIEADILEQTGSMDELSERREQLSSQLNDAGMAHIALVKESEGIENAIAELNARAELGGDRAGELAGQIERLREHIAELSGKTGKVSDASAALREQAKKKNDEALRLEGQRDGLEVDMRRRREEAREATEQREGVSNEKNRLEERMAQTQKEHDSILLKMLEGYNLTRREAEEQFEPAENERAAQKEVASLKGKIRALGSVNMGAIEEYAEVSERYKVYTTQISDVMRSKKELEHMIEELTATMQTMFTEAFEQISRNFAEIFPELYGGGSGKLTLLDDGDALSCGIDIEITPPGKEKQSMMGMSGGEKSLIAVAVYFAIMRVRPSPFCFLDEVDSALDENNVVNLARYIRRFVPGTQYVIITHRRGMMEAADMLYGVTKQNGVSRLLELNLDEVEKKLGKLDG